mmetsp:Transcript_34263/g.82918  ORF Transcript_34263/g.82918 Transcript_34263/m.82918 type:complete len:216 (+) Transcript_34263:423-1070(+)
MSLLGGKPVPADGLLPVLPDPGPVRIAPAELKLGFAVSLLSGKPVRADGLLVVLLVLVLLVLLSPLFLPGLRLDKVPFPLAVLYRVQLAGEAEVLALHLLALQRRVCLLPFRNLGLDEAVRDQDLYVLDRRPCQRVGALSGIPLDDTLVVVGLPGLVHCRILHQLHRDRAKEVARDVLIGDLCFGHVAVGLGESGRGRWWSRGAATGVCGGCIRG